MPKPVIFTVDDQPEVLRALEQDLRRQYGEHYRIMRATAGGVALDALQQLAERGEKVALLLVDQRMPQMTGIELLTHAMRLFPDAKRVLLTAYADTDVAIRAINEIGLDHYLLKPWNPPEDRLYPILDELLADWWASYQPPFEGIELIDHRWSPRLHELKEFLATNLVPYRWLNVEAAPEAQAAMGSAGPGARLPLVRFPDGTLLSDPPNREVAMRIGLKMQPERPFYDLIVVGAGPAGLAAGVYGASEGLHTLLIERWAPGGQAGGSARIENYLGFPSGLSGAELTRRAVAQARRLGAEILSPQRVIGLRAEGPYRIVTIEDGTELTAHAVLIATGVTYHTLDVPGCEPLQGAGVYYGAAMTEAMSYRDQDVLMVGGGNSAGQAAVYFSRFAHKVTMVVRGQSLDRSMSHYLVQQIADLPNIEVRDRTEVIEVLGEGHFEAACVIDHRTGGEETIPGAALFIFIGTSPRTDWLAGVVKRNPDGYIVCGPSLEPEGRRPPDWPLERDPFLFETNVPGVFAAGDVRFGSVKRIATAVGEGAMVVKFIHEYLVRPYDA